MPIQEAKISTNVRLRFRTHQENALIFLSSGRTDFCLLALDYGRIKLNFKIDDYTLEVGDYYYSYKTSDF
jgi:chondroitin sulfate proteoglycan 4